MMDRVGQQLGNYRIVSLLGRGGFADVYQGEHIFLKRAVAVKVLQARITSQEELDSFLKEAQTVAQLNHPNIVRVTDFGITDETPFLVMDYAPGGTLRTRYPKGTQLSPAQIVPYVRQIADALSYAHNEKLIHRDVKPENMLVGSRGEILLSDFGIALISQSSRYQGVQDITGTVAYMAPEQIQGKPSRASDQYALGIVVYEWLSGDRPFHGSLTELYVQHMFAPPPPLHEKVPTISPDIEHVVMTALAKEAKQRFGNVLAFSNALAQAAGSAEPTRVHPKPQPQPEPEPQRPISEPSPKPQSEPLPPPLVIAPIDESVKLARTEPMTDSFVASTPIKETSFPNIHTLDNVSEKAEERRPTLSEPQIQPIKQEEEIIQPVLVKPANLWKIGKTQIIAIVVGSILYALLRHTFIRLGATSFDPFFTVYLFFGAAFGPIVGLIVGLIGSTIGNVFFFPGSSSSTFYLGETLIALVAGLSALPTKGRYRTIRSVIPATLISIVGLIVGIYIIFTAISQSSSISFILTNGIIDFILLPVLLLTYDRIAHGKERTKS